MPEDGPSHASGQHRISRIGLGTLNHGESESVIVHGSETGDFANVDLMVVFADQGQCGGEKVRRWPSFAPNPFRSRVRAELRRVGGGQNAEVAVDVADAAETGDHLLADVTALGGTDGIGFETGFGWEGVGSDIGGPER